MKRVTYYLLLAVFLTAASGWSTINAQSSHYKRYHINENFDNLEAAQLPEGWSYHKDPNGLFTRGGSLAIEEGAVRVQGGGSGLRGVDIYMPTPQSNTTIEAPEDSTWFIEFDWTVKKSSQTSKNVMGLTLSGTGSKDPSSESFYIAAIFGLYAFGDGFFHYSNMDPEGYYDDPARWDLINPEPALADKDTINLKDDEITLAHYGKIGPAIRPGNNAGFRRSGRTSSGTSKGSSEEYIHSPEKVINWNASTKTNVAFKADSIVGTDAIADVYYSSTVYHITAELNFETQRVVNLTITQKDLPSNTQTISDMPFLAPSMIGIDTTLVMRDKRIVRDIYALSNFNTRASLAGSGRNVDFNATFDNLQIYYLVPSVGTADVTVNYVDQDGNVVKTARTEKDQQYQEPFRLSATDKSSFSDANFYYAYNAAATLEANIDKGADGESLIIGEGENSLTVVFKKFPKAAGAFIWTGEEGPYWNEVDGNFKSDATSGLGYQEGNAVTFSDALAPKDVVVNSTINLGTSDLTFSAGGYALSGAGKITGSGKTLVNAATTLGVENTTGVFVNTTEPVTINATNIADSVVVADNANLIFGSIPFAKKIIGAGEGSTLNTTYGAPFEDAFSYSVSNVSTVNLHITEPGGRKANNWFPKMSASYAANTQLNVINATGIDTLAGFSGIHTTALKDTKVHLGDKIRFVRIYNETEGETDTFGAISGEEGSFIEAGFQNRQSTYAVGNLNTDAVFKGTIRAHRADSTGSMHLSKIGTGKWTLTGNVDHPGTIIAKGGILELLGWVGPQVTTITVDSSAVLRTGNIVVESANVNVNLDGILSAQSTQFTGNVQVSGLFQGASGMFSFGLIDGELKLTVNSFETGDYEVINSESDATVIRSNINLRVFKATEGSIIQLITAGSGMVSYPEGFDNCSVFVNGVDITNNTEETPGAEFVWFPESGELMSLVTKEYSAVNDITTDKVVKTVEYYNLLGSPVAKDAKGIVIFRIIYTDGSVATGKVLN